MKDYITQKIDDLSDKIITSVEKQDESLQIVKLHNADAKPSWVNAVNSQPILSKMYKLQLRYLVLNI